MLYIIICEDNLHTAHIMHALFQQSLHSQILIVANARKRPCGGAARHSIARLDFGRRRFCVGFLDVSAAADAGVIRGKAADRLFAILSVIYIRLVRNTESLSPARIILSPRDNCIAMHKLYCRGCSSSAESDYAPAATR
jgi:hypothetical protein